MKALKPGDTFRHLTGTLCHVVAVTQVGAAQGTEIVITYWCWNRRKGYRVYLAEQDWIVDGWRSR